LSCFAPLFDERTNDITETAAMQGKSLKNPQRRFSSTKGRNQNITLKTVIGGRSGLKATLRYRNDGCKRFAHKRIIRTDANI
jgi:hypothetical protein